MTEIWWGRVLWRGYVHPHNHPHTQLKKSGIPHTHTQSMRRFPVKMGTGSGNTHGDRFICHIYLDVNCKRLREELDWTTERRERVVVRAEACKRMVAKRYNAKVRPKSFVKGDLVWRKTNDARKKSA